jgi:MFS family permease
MATRVTREYVDDSGGDVVYEDARSSSVVGAIVSLVLLGLLIWALFWGPIGEMFDGDGQKTKVDGIELNQ